MGSSSSSVVEPKVDLGAVLGPVSFSKLLLGMCWEQLEAGAQADPPGTAAQGRTRSVLESK